MNEDLIQEQLKGWHEAFDWSLANMNKPITEWPPGWVVETIQNPHDSDR